MARDWRRAILAALAGMMLGGACALGAFAQQAEDEPEDAKSETKAKKKQDPAEAQRIIDAALKQVLAGKLDQAVQAVSAAMAAGNLPPAIMAKALYVRGVAYRKQGRTAQAISDLTGALWLKGGLGGDEREDAIKEKAAAYADAGLADPGSSKPAPRSAGGGNNWFSGIFGGLGGEAPSPPPKVSPKVASAPVEVEPPTQPRPKAPSAKGLSSSWSGTTNVQEPPPKAPAPKAPKTAKVAPPPTPSDNKAEGPYLVQLAAMRTEAEALALAAKAKREHGSLLGSRGQSIARHVYGNMGAYYRVRFGPFASAQETQTVCARLQGSGIDCLPVNQ